MNTQWFEDRLEELFHFEEGTSKSAWYFGNLEDLECLAKGILPNREPIDASRYAPGGIIGAILEHEKEGKKGGDSFSESFRKCD